MSAAAIGERAERNRKTCDTAAQAKDLTAAQRRVIVRCHAMNSLISNNVGELTPPEFLPGIQHLADAADELCQRVVLPFALRARAESDAATEAANRLLVSASGGLEE